jgi:hypothetical protein
LSSRRSPGRCSRAATRGDMSYWQRASLRASWTAARAKLWSTQSTATSPDGSRRLTRPRRLALALRDPANTADRRYLFTTEPSGVGGTTFAPTAALDRLPVAVSGITSSRLILPRATELGSKMVASCSRNIRAHAVISRTLVEAHAATREREVREVIQQSWVLERRDCSSMFRRPPAGRNRADCPHHA